MELVLIAVSLSMDAFAVALSKGLSMKKLNYAHGAIIALFFGVFQGIMPLIGWLLGKQLEQYIVSVDHWIAFVLLAYIGGRMVYDTLRDKEDDEVTAVESKIDYKEMLMLSVATSIDALMIGVAFASLQTPIIPSVCLIASITFGLSFLGVIVGNRFGLKFKKKAEIAGGVVLILIGLKVLLEHLGAF
jgi:putative Mn2+ efflux pump MntP